MHAGKMERSRMPMKSDGDACREDGTLKDANEIRWLNSPSEDIVQLPKWQLEGGSRSDEEVTARKKTCVSNVTGDK